MQLSDFLSQHPIIAIGLAIGLLHLIRIAYAMRQGVVWVLQAFFVALIVTVIAQAFAASKGIQGQSGEGVGIFFGAIAFGMFPKRSRHIPSQVKKHVVGAYSKGGRKYDSREHHLDHIVPFSKGGSHTPDNLRVVPKKRNLKKGAKMPTPADWL
jgi:hypothetical protein